MNALTTMSRHGITLPMGPIAEFCRRWKIRELAVFGSFLRDDFGDQSDIDLLIDATTGANWTFAELLAWMPMQKKKPNISPDFLPYFRYNQLSALVFWVYPCTMFHAVRYPIQLH
jgi:predicted nucleotidyltransferase